MRVTRWLFGRFIKEMTTVVNFTCVGKFILHTKTQKEKNRNCGLKIKPEKAPKTKTLKVENRKKRPCSIEVDILSV